jgi:hypothetical protein
MVLGVCVGVVLVWASCVCNGCIIIVCIMLLLLLLLGHWCVRVGAGILPLQHYLTSLPILDPGFSHGKTQTMMVVTVQGASLSCLPLACPGV